MFLLTFRQPLLPY